MSKSLKRVTRALHDAGLDPDVREMAESTRTAVDAAAAIGCQVDQIAKSIIFAGESSGNIHLFLTAGGNQVDPAKAAMVAGEPLRRADAAEIRAKTGFAIGGVAPLGHLNPLPAYFDPRLGEFPEIWAASGTPRHVFAISPDELLKLTGAQTTDFAP